MAFKLINIVEVRGLDGGRHQGQGLGLAVVLHGGGIEDIGDAFTSSEGNFILQLTHLVCFDVRKGYQLVVFAVKIRNFLFFDFVGIQAQIVPSDGLSRGEDD